MFAAKHDDFWPGFDFAERPLVFYEAGRWKVGTNGLMFTQPPHVTAIDIGIPASLQCGETGSLVGQLAFGVDVGGAMTTAIPLPYPPQQTEAARSPVLPPFAFVIHEAFHDFQRTAFQDIDSPAEERYPILDVDNSTLVVLEMKILAAATAALEPDSARRHHLSELFLAVRNMRWRNAPLTVRAYEVAKELVEGTAKYVEVRSVAALAESCRDLESRRRRLLCAAADSVRGADYLLREFDDLLVRGALVPEDVPRNRIYPQGAALGLLLDRYLPSWKRDVGASPPTSSLSDLLESAIPLDQERAGVLFEQAKARFGFDSIRAATARHVDQYLAEFAEAMRQFDNQTGTRVEVEIPSTGLTRSRSSRAKRWVLNEGATVFANEYIVYTLRRPGADSLFLQARGIAVLERLVDKATTKQVVFYSPAVRSVVADGRPIDPARRGSYTFSHLSLSGDNFALTYAQTGVLSIDAGLVSVTAKP